MQLEDSRQLNDLATIVEEGETQIDRRKGKKEKQIDRRKRKKASQLKIGSNCRE